MTNWTSQPEQPDSHKTVSGDPGAVQTVKPVEFASPRHGAWRICAVRRPLVRNYDLDVEAVEDVELVAGQRSQTNTPGVAPRATTTP